MKQKLRDLTIMLIVITLSSISFAAAADFSDVPQSHWAYDYVSRLSEKGIINGMGDGTFQPDQKVTREQFIKMLVCSIDNTPDNSTASGLYDVEAGRWSEPYISAAIKRGIYDSGANGDMFYPQADLKRGVSAEWIVNSIGVNTDAPPVFSDVKGEGTQAGAINTAAGIGLIKGYEDNTFKPDNTITRAEAAALILRVIEYNEAYYGLREDAENKIVIQDSVKLTNASDTVNVPVSADEAGKTVTFSGADETLRELEPGDILMMPPSENFPEGLTGKVVSTQDSGKDIVIKFEEPSIAEVFESIDISTNIAVPPECFGDDGELSASKAVVPRAYVRSVESGENGIDLYFDGDAGWDVDIEWKGILPDVYTDLYGDLSETATIHFENKNYKDKKGFYAALNAVLIAKVDVNLETENLSVSSLSATANVKTDILATAGYSNSVEKEKRFKLPTAKVPLGGVLKLTIESELVVGVKGDLKIESNARLSNDIGIEYTLANGVSTHNTSNADADFTLESSGTFSFGPDEKITLSTSGITLPIINKTILEGASILEANGYAGIEISGKTKINKSVSLSSENGFESRENEDIKHDCLFCIEGDMSRVVACGAGLGEDLQKLVNKITEKKFYKDLGENKKKLKDWHLSSGEGYNLEFKFEKCPHYSYKADVNVMGTNGSPVSGAKVSVSGKASAEAETDKTGHSVFYLKPGDYNISAKAEKYKDNRISLKVKNKAVTAELKLESDKRITFSSCIGEVNGKIYSVSEYDGMQKEGMEVLPAETFVEPSTGYKYSISNFCCYDGYVYYVADSGGTSDFKTILYRCKTDWTDARILAQGTEYPWNFVIDDNVLYWRSGYRTDKYALSHGCSIDLNTLEKVNKQLPGFSTDGTTYKDNLLGTASDFAIFNNCYFYNKGGSIYKSENNAAIKLIQTSEQVYLNDGGVAGGYLYYATYDKKSFYGILWKVPLKGGTPIKIASHQTAGGGGPFFNH